MTIATAQAIKVYMNFEGRIGLWDGETPPAQYSDFINFETIGISAPEQEEVKLISRMTSSYGTALDAQNVASDTVAAVEIEATTFTPGMLEMMLGATVTEVTQTTAAVSDEVVNTALNVWVPLANRGLAAAGTGTEISLATSGDVAVDASKYEIDLVLGMIKATHADAVGTGMKLSYHKADVTWEAYESGLAKTTYVHITGQATEKVSNKVGMLDIWRASLKSSGSFNPIGGEYLKGALSGDLITPAVAIRGATPTAPWTWRRRTA